MPDVNVMMIAAPDKIVRRLISDSFFYEAYRHITSPQG